MRAESRNREVGVPTPVVGHDGKEGEEEDEEGEEFEDRAVFRCGRERVRKVLREESETSRVRTRRR